METVDDEAVAATIDFIKRHHAAGKPFFVWWSGTRMHFRTHVKPEHRGISDQDEYFSRVSTTSEGGELQPRSSYGKAKTDVTLMDLHAF